MSVHDGSLEGAATSPSGEAATAPRTRLITVHGTGAGDSTAAGDRWWQLGSAFLEGLRKRLDLDPSKVEISPFQWEEGPNSELARRQAGERLCNELVAADAAGEDYCLIAHSHGGTVVYNALLRCIAQGLPLERLKCWCTVGTPFLDYRKNTFLFQRLDGLGLTLYATGLGSIFLSLLTWVNLGLGWPFLALDISEEALADNGRFLEPMGWSLLVLGALCLAGLFLYERRKRSWYTPKQKRQVASEYSDRWLGLWHLEDEAISALSNIQRVSAPIISKTFLRPFVAGAQLAAVIVPALYLAYDLLVKGGSILVGESRTLLEGTDMTTETMDSIVAGLVGGNAVSILLLLFLIWLATLLLKLLAHLLGSPLAWSLNRLIWLSVRRRAWGDDLVKEDVGAIAAHPPEFGGRFDSLPEPVAEPLRKHSEKHAIVALHKVREVLGMTRDSPTTGDLRAQLSENLQWQELIHTAYFDVPEFIDLVALGLHRAGLAELRDGAVPTAEREALETWLEEGASTPA